MLTVLTTILAAIILAALALLGLLTPRIDDQEVATTRPQWALPLPHRSVVYLPRKPGKPFWLGRWIQRKRVTPAATP